MQKKAGVIGLGLIGGSIGLALREEGWEVIGSDNDTSRVHEALDMGAINDEGSMKDCEIVFVATPVASIADSVHRAFQEGAKSVTDVGSVKGSIVKQVEDRRFIPGHPMAGSEQEGIRGARADLFRGAAWVLTPKDGSDDSCFEIVQSAGRVIDDQRPSPLLVRRRYGSWLGSDRTDACDGRRDPTFL